MKKIALFYSFNTNNSAKVADKIAKAIGGDKVEKVNVEMMSDDEFLNYDNLILGVPTWFDGELPNYWDEFIPALDDMDMKGKVVAIFGLGDQEDYPENFADAVGILGEKLESRGAKLIGETSTEGFEFERSLAIRDGKFMGLVLDEDNQADLTDKRIDKWVKDITKKFK